MPQNSRQIRYAVAGLGYIAQQAVLPAFAHAAKNSTLAALISDDAEKLRVLGKRYGVSAQYSYAQYEEALAQNKIDAVFIALPNDMHREFTERAAKAGVHVLCEKPMAIEEEDCQAMIRVCEERQVKLMVAYRLHNEPANLAAVELVKSGKLGAPRLFNSSFSFQVTDPDNIRLKKARGGGPLYDIGTYCINAARYMFQAEPVEASAFTAKGGDPRFSEVEESLGAVLRFPNEALAVFNVSFGAAESGYYELIGTKGSVRLDPAFEYASGLVMHVEADGRSSTREFPQRDQFAAELLYFSNCILNNEEPEPSGHEGLADVRIIRALLRSAETGQAVKLEPFDRTRRPSQLQRISRPPAAKEKLIRARGPSE